MKRRPLPRFHGMADAIQQLEHNPRLQPYRQADLDAELRHVSRVTGEPLPKLVRKLNELDAHLRGKGNGNE